MEFHSFRRVGKSIKIDHLDFYHLWFKASTLTQAQGVDHLRMAQAKASHDVASEPNAHSDEVLDVQLVANLLQLGSQLVHGGVNVGLGKVGGALLLTRGGDVVDAERLHRDAHVDEVEEGLKVGYVVHAEVVVGEHDVFLAPVLDADDDLAARRLDVGLLDARPAVLGEDAGGGDLDFDVLQLELVQAAVLWHSEQRFVDLSGCSSLVRRHGDLAI